MRGRGTGKLSSLSTIYLSYPHLVIHNSHPQSQSPPNHRTKSERQVILRLFSTLHSTGQLCKRVDKNFKELPRAYYAIIRVDDQYICSCRA